MNISTNSASFRIANSVTANRLATASGVSASVNLNADNTAPVDLSEQAPVVVNPTYDRPVNNQTSKAISPALTEITDNEQQGAEQTVQRQQGQDEKAAPVDKQISPETAKENANKGQFTEVELELISDLKLRHSEVYKHERAHSSVGGQYAGSPNYSYRTGPDGIKYAVSGEVSIDTSKIVNNPQATLQKAQQIKAAALAPSQPSAQDRRVAVKAEQMATQARSEIVQENSGRTEKATNRANVSYQVSQSDRFTRSESLAKENNSPHQLTNRIEQINNVYQSSSTIKTTSTFQTQV